MSEKSGCGVRPVLVTGFGPFGHHSVNASWASVQELEKLGIQNSRSQSVPLVTREVPVAYDGVSQIIPELLKDVTLSLCVHVGVSPYKHVVMEKRGSNFPYIQADIYGKVPEGNKCAAVGPDYIETAFNVQRILEKVSQQQRDVKFDVSNDAGHYLCDFIYYTTLHANCVPVLFVHVPELDNPYTVHQLACALKNIIETLLSEVL